MSQATKPLNLLAFNRKNLTLWFLLAFQAGAVNAGGFIACKRFVTHTTGFATHFGYELASKNINAAVGMLSVPAFFLLGAMITSYFVDLALLEERAPDYKVPSLLIVLALLSATALGELGAFGIFGEEVAINHDYLFMVLLCLASGLQNALITSASGRSIRTTHLTGVTTDLASSLVRLLFGQNREPHHLERDRSDSLSRAGIILFFVLGSTLCAFLFLRAQYLGFIVPTITSLVMLRFFMVKT